MNKIKWNKAENSPNGTDNQWTEEVVVLSNYGNVYSLSYFNGINGEGVWQRPAAFNKGEEVEYWIEKPY